jgi:hypothetical protein
MSLFLTVLILYGAMCCIPAAIASSKGRSFAGFWCLSFFVPFGFFIALIVALCLKREPQVVYVVQAQQGVQVPSSAAAKTHYAVPARVRQIDGEPLNWSGDSAKPTKPAS